MRTNLMAILMSILACATIISSEYSAAADLSAAKSFAQSTLPTNAAYVVVNSLQQAEKVATNHTLQYIVVSDGTHHAVFEKNRPGALQYTWSGSLWSANFKEYVPIIAFASSTQGDATAAFDAAVTIAAKFRLGIEFPANAAYTISTNVYIKNGVKYLRGNGTSLTAQNMAPLTNVFRLVRGASNLEITGFIVDLNHLPKVDAIVASNPQNLNIHHMRFVNVASRAINIYSNAGVIDNINIKHNIIQAVAGNSDNKGVAYGIAVSNGMDTPPQYKGTHNPIWLQYVQEGTVAKNPYPVSGINISYNQIDGGYYAISLFGVTNSNISHNLATNNVRNISMQSNSSGNAITHNYLNNSTSSSVHIAYNSNNNIVQNNTIVSERARGQGLLQAYQSSNNNIFSHNSIEILSKNGPSWVLYAATGSSNNTFKDNLIDSPMSRSLIGIEAIWDSNSAKGESSSYMQAALNDAFASSGTITYNGGNGPLNNTRIEGNIFLPKSPSRPLLYVGAGRSSGHSGKENIIANVTNLSFSGNTIFGNQYSELERIRENGAAVRRLKTNHNATSTQLAGSRNANNNILIAGIIGSAPAKHSNKHKQWLYSIIPYTLDNNLHNLHLIGSSAINGTGNNADNILMGNAYDNVLDGAAGNDIIIGGYGSNTLTGGAGADIFVFDAPANGQVDRITDFNLTEDKISLSKIVFGELLGNWFAATPAVVNANTRIFQDGNRLYYDADGAAQYFKATPFVELQSAIPLNLSHFNFSDW